MESAQGPLLAWAQQVVRVQKSLLDQVHELTQSDHRRLLDASPSARLAISAAYRFDRGAPGKVRHPGSGALPRPGWRPCYER
jgi:hypothetical protein